MLSSKGIRSYRTRVAWRFRKACPALVCLPILAGITLRGADEAYLAVTSSTTQFRQVAISPDGKRVAYVEGVRNADNSDSRNSLVYVTEEGGPPKRITVGSSNTRCQEKDIAWSP